MFGRKSNVTVQIKIKENLLQEINSVLYKLEKGKFNKGLNEDIVKPILKETRKAYEKLANSIGTGEEDLTYGSQKVKTALDNLVKASQNNLDGRFEESALDLIEDIEEIVDLENGIISEISSESDSESKKQKTFNRKLLEVEKFGQEFLKNKNRVEDEITNFERDKKELDRKLLEEQNSRLKNNIFREIKATMNKIDTLQVKSAEYSSCYNLLDSIKIYAKELIELGDLSSVEIDKAKIILNINRIRFVLDNPKKLQSLLKVIELDLKKSQEKIKTRDTQVNEMFSVDKESFDEMNEYQNQLIKQNSDKEEISRDTLDLEDYLKTINKE